jgi:UDP-N-acetylglucosamine diphosphorylase/glucosamine-1-phosphate N-acetyltransferase
MNYILFDDSKDWQNLLPLTFTRPISHIRIGILTILEKWEKYLDSPISVFTEPYLQKKFTPKLTEDNIFINSTVLPNAHLIEEIKKLELNARLFYQDVFIAQRQGKNPPDEWLDKRIEPISGLDAQKINYCFDIFRLNGTQIQADFQLITKNRVSQPIQDKFTAVYGEENIFIEEGVKVRACVLNAENGVIYLGKNSQVSEGAVIQGNFCLGENSVVNLGAKMRPNTTIGPYCKVGGEVSNSILFGNSNKGHEGFLGNSVLGEWCNLGADTNNSNLKNNYSSIKIWNYTANELIDSELQFAGLIMGDHSKAGINSMFNTGTVVGVSANVFGGGFPPKFVPSFSWGGSDGFEIYNFDQALDTAQRVLSRRNLLLSEEDKNILQEIFVREKDRINLMKKN